MTQPLLVLIGGAPATGKTMLAQRLAGELALPLFAKDAIKERLFDTLGWSDRAWSQRIGPAAFELLFDIVEAQMRAGASCIVEGNFYRDIATPRLLDFQRRYAFTFVQVICVCEAETAVERFRARWEAGRRHPGHVEDTFLAAGFAEQLREQMARGVYDPLALDGPVLTFDTNDLTALDDAPILAAIRQAMAQS
jgi:predicted kinase